MKFSFQGHPANINGGASIERVIERLRRLDKVIKRSQGPQKAEFEAELQRHKQDLRAVYEAIKPWI